jgi:hypothetical protein
VEAKTVESGYLERVTAYFIEKRGRGAFVSPADLALLVEWERAGVPVSAVAQGIDRAVDAFGEVRSVRGCRRFIVAEVERLGPRVIPRPTSSGEELRPALEAALFSLDDLRRKHPRANEAFLRASKRLNGVLETVTEGGFDSSAAVVEELAIIEDGLADDLTDSLPPDELTALDERVRKDLDDYKKRMEPAEFEATVKATVRAAVLRRFGARGVLII